METVVEEPDVVMEAEVDLDAMRIQARRVIEALLFASQDPIPLRRFTAIIEQIHPFKSTEIKEILDDLTQEYEENQNAFEVREIAKGYLLCSREEFAPYIEELFQARKKDRISHAQAEVLSIIAYKQPITRAQIEDIRGVDCSGIVYTLLEKQLIESVGKLEVAGRPTLFGVTDTFLKHFGLKDTKELPNYELLKAVKIEEAEETEETEETVNEVEGDVTEEVVSEEQVEVTEESGEEPQSTSLEQTIYEQN